MPTGPHASTISCVLCGGRAALHCALEGGTYYRCSACRGLFLHPIPTVERMRAYAEGHYQGGVYAEYVKARPLKLETFRRRLALIRRHQRGGSLLDLGAAAGFMVEAALEAGYDARGVEFSEEAIRQAAPEIRGRIRRGDVNEIEPGQYDVVTAFDILEHAQDPLASLRQWASLLRPGGVLAITSPDTDSLLRKVMGSRWPMLQPLQHTAMFAGSAFPGFLERAGLATLAVRSAEKVMTLSYLLGQLEIYFPRATRVARGLGRALPRLMERPIGFHIGEFIAVARRPSGRDARALNSSPPAPPPPR